MNIKNILRKWSPFSKPNRKLTRTDKLVFLFAALSFSPMIGIPIYHVIFVGWSADITPLESAIQKVTLPLLAAPLLALFASFREQYRVENGSEQPVSLGASRVQTVTNIHMIVIPLILLAFLIYDVYAMTISRPTPIWWSNLVSIFTIWTFVVYCFGAIAFRLTFPHESRPISRPKHANA